MASTNYLVLKEYTDVARQVRAQEGMIVAYDPAIPVQGQLVTSHLAGNVIMLASGAAASQHPIAVAVTKLATAPA